MEVYTESTIVHGSTCSYIFTKCTGMHVVTPTEKSKVKMVVRVKSNAYGKYRRYGPIWYIGTEVVGKVQKGISYSDALNQGS